MSRSINMKRRQITVVAIIGKYIPTIYLCKIVEIMMIVIEAEIN